MKFQYIPYLWPLIISAFVSFSLGVYAFIRQLHSKCAVSFIMSMLIVTVWSLGNALEMSGIDFFTKLFWANIQYFSYCYSPLALLALCMRFTGYDKWLNNKKFLWLLIMPTIVIVLVWTDRFHGLIRYNMRLDMSSNFPIISKEYGPVFFVHAIYGHIINITAIILLVRAVIYRKTVYRKQAVILLIGASFIVFPNLLYITGLSPVKQLDLTPVFFGPAGALIAWAIFRYKMFELVPLARATVIETMDAGMMILDRQGRILDINPAFEKIMGISAKQASTRYAEEICHNVPELMTVCIDINTLHAEFNIKNYDGAKIYEALLSPLTDSKGLLLGRLVMVYEITEKKKSQQQYLEQPRRLAAANEKESLTRDLHDNLGQILGFINLQAQGIRQELLNEGIVTVSDKLDRLVEVTETAHNEIRAYIKSARSLSSSDNDFLKSPKNDILHFEERSDIPTEFNTNLNLSDIGLKPQVQLHLLSIAKEALNNIQKHSGANHVNLSFLYEKEKLFLTIEDNGKGFNILNTDDKAGKTFGLSIMRERAAEIGADINIASTPGKGCKISLVLPYSQEGGKYH